MSGASIEIAELRQQKIRAFLLEEGVVRVDGLAETLGVSVATVRRDLDAMEKAGDLRRVHGGAVPARERDDEPVFDDKAAIATQEKQAIAEAALGLIPDRATIYLDGGSTVLALARLLAARTDLTVVTNSLRVAQVLSANGPKMILTGGECRRLSQTFVGPLTCAVLDQVHLDLAFMGTIGISGAAGLTTTDPAEAFTKEHAISRASVVVLLADGTKFAKTSFIRFGGLETLDELITDRQPPAAEWKALRKAGVRMILAMDKG